MNHHPKRRKKRPVHGIKTVDVIRGRSGYGFTISGQHPCVLSCIVSGSPAEVVGLKPGDYIVAVNGENVTKASHDDVVRIVGLSTGTIELQVAENYNSSDSSDDDYPPRTKSRYPNRIRPRHGHAGKDKYQFSEVPRLSGHLHSYGELRGSNSRNRNHAPVGAEPDMSNSASSQSQSSSFTSQEPTNSSANTASFNSFSVHNRTRQSQRQESKSSLNSKNGLSCSSTSVQFQELQTSHEMSSMMRHCSDGRLQEALSHSRDRHDLIDHVSRHASCSNLQGASAMAALPCANCSQGDQDDDDSFEMNVVGDIRAVVGYVGSIEMPGNANRTHQRLQSLRNAVRRLRKEQKIHTLVLMEVGEDGVKLTNSTGCSLAQYPVERLVFSGICPDDKRFFGIVTLHSSSDDVSELSQQQADHAVASSCHIFMVDPELRSHNMHAQKARTFNIQCTVNPETQRCREFPRSATAIILSVANLYKNRPQASYDNDIVQSQAFADPARAVQRSSSNSSNSDSGLGFGKEDRANEQVFVVEMPVENRQHSNSAHSESLPAFPVQAAQEHPHISPDVPTLPTPRKSAFSRPHSAFEMCRAINNSTISEECWQGNKLNLRAMGDTSKTSNIWRAKSSDDLDKANSAENLRHSMHKLMQARQRHKSEQTVSSDSESQTSGHSDFTPTNRPSFSSRRPVSAPFAQLSHLHSVSDKVEMVDMAVDKLSPRVFFRPPDPTLRSPSAPTIPYFNHHDDDDSDESDEEEEDPMVRGIISRLNRDKAFGMTGEDPRRFSEGYILAKKREKEKASLEAVQKWSKRGSFQNQRNMKLQLPISQSHESLIEPDVHSKLVNATSVNNIASHDREEKREVGRVAGWAVSFDKLLHDFGGVAVFTEFLKKEFSEENIIFWQACADYKKLTSDDQKKVKAKEIYNRHLSVRAPDPVNVDSSSRHQAEKFLDNPTSIMFDMAQMHIHQLMKQDSYVRFLKCDLYKVYLMREMEGQPLCLPLKEDLNIVLEKEKSKSGKGKENEKRRRSLLPWRQGKSKQSAKAASNSELKLLGKDVKRLGKEVNNNSKKPPGPGIDLSTMRKEVFQTKEEMRDVNEGQFKFCRVVLPDGSTTVVCAKPGQSIRAVLGKLCEKRGLSIAAVDVFMLGADKPLDLGDDVSTLGSKEVLIERRVLFRMDLPNKKSIGVKAKPNRSIRDVFKPILNKYGYRIDNIYIQLTGLDSYLDAEIPVSDIDNQRVVIIPRDETSEWAGQDGASSHVTMAMPSQHPPLPPARHKYGSGNVKAATSLDELTNRIFDDLMKGKSEIAHGFDELGVVELDRQKKNHEDNRLSALFGLRKKDSLGVREAKQKAKVKATAVLPRTEVHFRRRNSEDEKLFELLSRAQSQRLDDQRGVGMPNPEIPEFLRRAPEPDDVNTLLRCQSTGDLFDDVEYMQADGAHSARTTEGTDQHDQNVTRRSLSSVNIDANCSAQSDDFTFSNRSFSSDGFFPSTEMADAYFQMQPVIVETCSSDVERSQVRFRKDVQRGANGGADVFGFHQQSTFPSGMGKDAAPVASPERFSPGPNPHHHHHHHHHHRWSESLDDTLINSPRYSVHDETLENSPRYSPHKRLSPPPLPMPCKTAGASQRKHGRDADFSPSTPAEQNKSSRQCEDSKQRQHVDSSQRKQLNVNKYMQPVNRCNVENIEASWTKDKLMSKCVKSGSSNAGMTPKVLKDKHENGPKPVVLELSTKDELVTFV
ncbi:regulator of G-protein signaling 12-like isoform X2 [Gigantopelta aegis]|nr:regulator of G-protein signaling 12-like isoform X2 [Gigantopelta aegis]